MANMPDSVKVDLEMHPRTSRMVALVQACEVVNYHESEDLTPDEFSNMIINRAKKFHRFLEGDND